MKPSDYIRIGWTKGTLARDRNGINVGENDEDAVCWCIAGACFKAMEVEKAWNALDRLRAHLNREVSLWNDDPNRTQEKHAVKLRTLQEMSLWNDDPNRTQEEVIAALESVGL